VIKGIAGLGSTAQERQELNPLEKVLSKERHAAIVMGGAHTLAFTDDALVGDPIEKQSFEGIKFNQNAQGQRESTGPGGIKISAVKRFAFNSTLKRMSVLVNVNDGFGSPNSYRVLSKGAPEVLCKHIKNLPADYHKTYLSFVKNGARVLALAYKFAPKMTAQEMHAYARDEAEKDLTFVGFIVAECPLKPCTAEVITELKESSHEVKMITGDNAMTAAFIGQQLTFGRGSSVFASEATAQGKITWRDIDDEKVSTTTTPEEVFELSNNHMLCMNGDVLAQVILLENAADYILNIDIFSRTSPAQKGVIVGMLNQLGHHTLMCGDGTNDVGSLKQADVGVAIVNNKEPTSEQKALKKTMSMWPDRRKMIGMTTQQQQEYLQKHQEEYKKATGGMDQQLELGDACIAAPFTYKYSSLKSVKKSIRQGRSTLVSTFQQYKILSLNCLISAYTMSALYLDGVKMGDYQATYLGLGISIVFMMLSFNTPLKKLFKEKPPTSIFHWSLVISVSVQFVCHLSVLIYFVNLTEPYIDRTDLEALSLEGEFKPSLKNTVCFIYQWWNHSTVIFVNYYGRPFTQDIMESKKLRNGMVLMYAVIVAVIFEVLPEMNEGLELVPFPNPEFQQQIAMTLGADFVICYGIEKLMKHLYLQKFKSENQRLSKVNASK